MKGVAGVCPSRDCIGHPTRGCFGHPTLARSRRAGADWSLSTMASRALCATTFVPLPCRPAVPSSSYSLAKESSFKISPVKHGRVQP